MKAVVFPGQGSQKVGMAKEHYDSNQHFKKIVDTADQLLGYSIKELMFNGPADKLVQTKFTQPAIFLHSYALFTTMDIEPEMVAGHSLGEYSALAAVGVLPFEDALALVAKRGELMQHAGEVYPGTMAAIIGLDDELVDQICKEATDKIQKPVVAANYNCPGQLVISGDLDAVKTAVEIAKEKGCRLAKMLPVSGAFHSPLMEPAKESLKETLESVEFSTPACPVYCNVTAEATTDKDVIKNNVLAQLINPVRWTQTLVNMKLAGASEFVEIGPGKVLQGLVKRTLTDVSIKGYE